VNAVSARLRAALLAGKRRPTARGVGMPVARRSDGFEFAELRTYVAGDDPRRIDWAATARVGEMQTRVVYEDHALVLAAAIDASPSMFVGRTRTLYDRAIAAAGLWYGAAQDDDRCTRVLPDRLLDTRMLRGREAGRVCAAYRQSPGGAFVATLRLALATVQRGAALLIVSDFWELEALLPLLRTCVGRFDLTALIARDPWHAGLPLGGFVRLRDAETGRAARCYVGPRERDRYAAAVAERERTIVATIERCGIRCGALDDPDVETDLLRAFALA